MTVIEHNIPIPTRGHSNPRWEKYTLIPLMNVGDSILYNVSEMSIRKQVMKLRDMKMLNGQKFVYHVIENDGPTNQCRIWRVA